MNRLEFVQRFVIEHRESYNPPYTFDIVGLINEAYRVFESIQELEHAQRQKLRGIGFLDYLGEIPDQTKDTGCG